MNLVSRLANGNFFQTPLFLALTVGVPFGIFKLLFGILALRFALENHVAYLGGSGVSLWSGSSLDIIMNLLAAIFDLAGRKSPIDCCTLAEIGSFLGRPGGLSGRGYSYLILHRLLCTMVWLDLKLKLHRGQTVVRCDNHQPH